MWGLAIGIASFSFRYAILSGLFPIILDFDHWIQFLGIEMIPRMAHSITFGFIAVIIMMSIFGRRDLRLGAISIAAVFSHMSFDIFLTGTSDFPVFVPFVLEKFTFSGADWIIFEFLAASLIFVASIIVFRKQSYFFYLIHFMVDVFEFFPKFCNNIYTSSVHGWINSF